MRPRAWLDENRKRTGVFGTALRVPLMLAVFANLLSSCAVVHLATDTVPWTEVVARWMDDAQAAEVAPPALLQRLRATMDALLHACAAGDLAAVTTSLASGTPAHSQRDSDGASALMLAAGSGAASSWSASSAIVGSCVVVVLARAQRPPLEELGEHTGILQRTRAVTGSGHGKHSGAGKRGGRARALQPACLPAPLKKYEDQVPRVPP